MSAMSDLPKMGLTCSEVMRCVIIFTHDPGASEDAIAVFGLEYVLIHVPAS